MNMRASKVTSKGQTTILAEVRAKLKLKPGDAVVYRETKAGIIIRKASALDAEFLRLQEQALNDWHLSVADGAFRDL